MISRPFLQKGWFLMDVASAVPDWYLKHWLGFWALFLISFATYNSKITQLEIWPFSHFSCLHRKLLECSIIHYPVFISPLLHLPRGNQRWHLFLLQNIGPWWRVSRESGEYRLHQTGTEMWVYVVLLPQNEVWTKIRCWTSTTEHTV